MLLGRKKIDMGVGKLKNDIWFTSPTLLVKITTAREFWIKKCWFRKEWKLMAEMKVGSYYCKKVIGHYPNKIEASAALVEASEALGIAPLGSLD